MPTRSTLVPRRPPQAPWTPLDPPLCPGASSWPVCGMPSLSHQRPPSWPLPKSAAQNGDSYRVTSNERKKITICDKKKKRFVTRNHDSRHLQIGELCHVKKKKKNDTFFSEYSKKPYVEVTIRANIAFRWSRFVTFIVLRCRKNL